MLTDLRREELPERVFLVALEIMGPAREPNRKIPPKKIPPLPLKKLFLTKLELERKPDL